MNKENKSIQWWTPVIGEMESSLVLDVLKSHYVNEGDVTTDFEKRLAALVGAKHAVATSSGTAALFLSLAGVGVGPGDEVIVPDITFIATANAVSLTGAHPVLVDVDRRTLNMSAVAFENAITPRTKAVVPVHVSGRGAGLSQILEVAARHRVTVIEDAAEALLSGTNGKFFGTFGRAGCISFSPNKTITTGQGGMVFTNDDILHVRLRELKDQGRPVRGTGGDDIHRSVGYNFKLTNLQAAVGVGQLNYLHSRVSRLREIFTIYQNELSSVEGVVLPGFNIEDGEVPQWVDAVVDKRNELDAHLREKNMHCRRFWHPLHTQAPYRGSEDSFKNSSELSSRAIWLPSAFTLSNEDIHSVCKEIQIFYHRKQAKAA